MPKPEILASGKRFQFFLKIINADFARMRFDGIMKRRGSKCDWLNCCMVEWLNRFNPSHGNFAACAGGGFDVLIALTTQPEAGL
jgi:hypothetical protein